MLKIDKYQNPWLINLNAFNDFRGNLVVGEFGKEIPFEVKRFFFIFNVPSGEPRGIHAHKECHQLLICVSGSVKAMVDDGEQRKVMFLDNPEVALHMPPMTWGAQYDYSPDAVLLVLASHQYDPNDYIHEYETFVELLGADSDK